MALVLGVLGFIVVTFVTVAWYVSSGAREPGAPPGVLLRLLAVVGVPALALVGAWLYVRLRPRHFVEVDADTGTATFVEDGAVARQVPVGEIGPLEHVVEQRRVSSGKSHRIVTYHVGRSRPLPELRFFESEQEMETRGALEARSKAWKVPYVKPSGEVRRPEDLDVPLFQRLGSDESATTSLVPRPDSQLNVAWRDDGYEITTSYRPKPDRIKLAAAFGIPLLGLFLYLHDVLGRWLFEGFGTPWPWLAAGAVVLARPRLRALRVVLLGLLAISTAVLAPLALPLLSPASMARYAAALHVNPRIEIQRKSGVPQWVADRLDWPELAAAVERARAGLPPEERAEAAFLAGDYGYAAAVERFGGPAGFARVIGTHNQYFLWGPGDPPPRIVVAFGVPRADVDRLFADVEQSAIFRCDLCYEDGLPILVARRPRIPLDAAWPSVRHFE